jgi:DNA-binding transcriptional ArsR family regulator
MPTHSQQTEDKEVMAKNNLFLSLSNLFGTLSHPVRIKIIRLLHEQECDVTHLQDFLGITQSNVSQHLHALKLQGLVNDRRDGKHVFYSLKTPQVLQLLACAVQLMALQLATDTELLTSCEELLSLLG